MKKHSIFSMEGGEGVVSGTLRYVFVQCVR